MKHLQPNQSFNFRTGLKVFSFVLAFISFQNIHAQTSLCYADAVISNTFNTCSPNSAYSNPADALGAPNFATPFPYAPNEFFSMGGLNSELILAFTDNTLTNDASNNPDVFVYEVGDAVEGTLLSLLPSNAYTEDAMDAAGLAMDADGFYSIGAIGGGTASVDIDALLTAPAGSLVFNQIKLINPNPNPGNCGTWAGPDIDAVCALSTAPCTDDDNDGVCDEFDNCVGTANANQADSDCDGVGDACDLCLGGDDTVDNNGDGLPDCAYPPSYNDIINAWKCGKNKVYICHVPPGNPSNAHTICTSKNAIHAHVGNHGGDYLGSCFHATCGTNMFIKQASLFNELDTEHEEHDIQIYPNPAVDYIEINMHDYADAEGGLTIRNMTGQIVYSDSFKKIPHHAVKLDVSNFESGIYYVSMKTADGIQMIKQIVVMK